MAGTIRAAAWPLLLILLLLGQRAAADPVLTLAVDRVTGVANGRDAVTLWVLARDRQGRAISASQLVFEGTLGQLRLLEQSDNGLLRYSWTPPATDRPGQIGLRVRDKRSGRTSALLKLNVLPPARLTIKPARPVLGTDKWIDLRIRAVDASGKLIPAGALLLLTSVGKISWLPGTQQAVARLMLPGAGPPRYASVRLLDRASGLLLAQRVLPLHGKITYLFETEPGAIASATLGARKLGPFKADAQGRLALPLVVSPRERTELLRVVVSDAAGNRTEALRRPVNAPRDDLLRIQVGPDAVPVGSQNRLPIRVRLLTRSGAPASEAPLLRVDRGRLTPLQPRGPGLWEGFYSPPLALGNGTILLTATAQQTGLVMRKRLRLRPGPLASVKLTAESDWVAAGASTGVGLLLRGADRHGNPVLLEDLRITASRGRLAALVAGPEGRLQSSYYPPAEVGEGRVVLEAGASTTQPRTRPVALYLFRSLSATGQLGIVARVVDAQSRSVSGVALIFLFNQQGQTVSARVNTDAQGLARWTPKISGGGELIALTALLAQQPSISATTILSRHLPGSSAGPSAPPLLELRLPSVMTVTLLVTGKRGGMTLQASPAATVADGNSSVKIEARLLDPSGKPLLRQQVKISVEGTALVVTEVGEGRYSASWRAPASGRIGVVQIEARAPALSLERKAVLTLLPLPAVKIDLTLDAQQIPADGRSSAVLTIRLLNRLGRGVTGQQIVLSADRGLIGSVSESGGGSYRAVYTAPQAGPGTARISARAGALVASQSLGLTRPEAAALQLTLQPAELPADGKSTFRALAKVTTADGAAVADGTSVQFSFSGQQLTGSTKGGQAEAVFKVGGEAGAFSVAAQAHSVSGEATLKLTDEGSAPGTSQATAVSLTLNPAELPADGASKFTAQARVTDAAGQGVSGVAVTFRLGSQSANASTSEQGTASFSFTAPTEPGTASVTASVSGLATAEATVRFVAASAVPASLTLTLDSSEVAVGGSVTATATVNTASGGPVADGTLVSFELSGASASVATAGGKAAATLSVGPTPGSYTVNASAGSASGSAPLTVVGAEPAKVVLTVSAAQVEVSGQLTLSAQVTDAGGNPVADGTEVDFSTTLGSLPATATTSGGKATATFDAGSAPGDAQITAAAGTVSDQVKVVITGGPPATIELILIPATLPADGVATSKLEAKVRDAFGNLLNGERINFSVPPGRGSLSPAFDLTDSSGIARVTYTAAILGTSTLITATSQRISSVSASETITETPLTPPAFTVVTSGAQSQIVGIPFGITLTALQAGGGTATDYTGAHTISFSSTATVALDGKSVAGLPASLTLTFIDGVASTSSSAFTLFNADESPTISASEGSAPSGSTTAIAVAEQLPSSYTVSTSNAQSEGAGVAFGVTLTARRSDGSTAVYHNGAQSISFSSTATAAPDGTAPIIPASLSLSFSAGVASSPGGDFTLFDSGETPTISASGGGTSGSSAITVNAAVLVSFSLSLTSPQVSGSVFSGTNTLTGLDIYGNGVAPTANTVIAVATGTGTVSGLPAAGGTEIGPTDFTAGVANLTALGLTYNMTSTPNPIRLSATSGGISDTSGDVSINDTAVVDAYLVSVATPQTAGVGFTLTLTAQKAGVTVTGSDADLNGRTFSFALVAPVNAPNGAAPTLGAVVFSSGVATVSITLFKAEKFVGGDKFGLKDHLGFEGRRPGAPLDVVAAALDHFILTIVNPQESNVAFAGMNTATAQDAFDNPTTVPAGATITASTDGSMSNDSLSAGDFVGGVADITLKATKYTFGSGSAPEVVVFTITSGGVSATSADITFCDEGAPCFGGGGGG